MRRALVVLVLLTGLAHAQQWSSDRGWDHAQFDQTRAQVERDIAEGPARMEKMRQDAEREQHTLGIAFGLITVGAIGLILFGLFSSLVRRRRTSVYEPVVEAATQQFQYAQLPSGNIDVTVLRIGVDGRAGKLVASEVARLTGQYETTSADGRSQLLRELGVSMRRVRAAWLYGGAVNEPMRSMAEANAVAAKHVDDARIPGADVGTSDSPGVVLTTIVVAARGELMSVDHVGAEELRRALEAAAYRDPSEIVAVHVVARRFGTAAELQLAYPDPQLVPLVVPGSNQVFCTYCGGPFSPELTTCPHCGAPARKAS